jgi:hypothetical protein
LLHRTANREDDGKTLEHRPLGSPRYVVANPTPDRGLSRLRPDNVLPPDFSGNATRQSCFQKERKARMKEERNLAFPTASTLMPPNPD